MDYNSIMNKYDNNVVKAWNCNRSSHTILYKEVLLPYDRALKMYIDEDKSLYDIISYIRDSYSITVTEKSLGKLVNTVYGLHKENASVSSAKNSKRNALKRTGYEHYRKNPSWKNTYVQENLKKYGKSSYLLTPDGKDKTKKTLLEKYHVDSPLKSKDILRKAQDTRRETINHIQPFTPTGYSRNVIEAIDIIKSSIALSTIFKEGITYGELETLIGLPYSTLQNYRDTIRTSGILLENSASTSYEEKEVLDFVSSIYRGTIVKNSRVLDGKEIDIYLPDLNLGIEFNGNYWHSDRFLDSNYHDNKSNIASSMGINLVNVWEDEWRIPFKREIVKSMLSYKLGVSERIYARKTDMIELSSRDAKKFYDNNHIQGGYNTHGYSYGLVYDGEVVSAMTFSKPRYSDKYDYELLRFANKLGYTVVGGASKLLYMFEKSVHPKSIISYSNRNFSKTSEHSLYSILGFKYIKHTKPMYIWVNSYTGETLSRYQTQTSKLKMLDDFRKDNPNETEYEYMSKKGYLKVSKVGNDLYVKEL